MIPEAKNKPSIVLIEERSTTRLVQPPPESVLSDKEKMQAFESKLVERLLKERMPAT